MKLIVSVFLICGYAMTFLQGSVMQETDSGRQVAESLVPDILYSISVWGNIYTIVPEATYTEN